MMPRIVPAVIMATILAGPAWAGSAAGPHTHPDTVDKEAAISIPGAARDAVATVDRFSTALTSGDLETAARELDSTVLILESGGAERSARPRVFIPASAVVRRAELTAVYVMGDGQRPQLRQVRLGPVQGALVEVLAGLDAGESLITDPQAATRAVANGSR